VPKLAADKRHPQSAIAAQEGWKKPSPTALLAEFNPLKHIWDELCEKRLHNHVFDNLDGPEDHLQVALKDFELHTQRTQSIVAWP
jgi:hypothetical protein